MMEPMSPSMSSSEHPGPESAKHLNVKQAKKTYAELIKEKF